MENNLPKFVRPAEMAESRLIDAILSGQYPPDSCLPSERDLAARLGITRPTLREALQRLGRDGWVEIHQGKPTRVRNYLKEGSLPVLSTMAERMDNLPDEFVTNLLSIRILLAPAYTALAIKNCPDEFQQYLSNHKGLPDKAADYCTFDWQLHQTMTVFSGNPVFTLILNGFEKLYWLMGLKYFSNETARRHSKKYYEILLEIARKNDFAAAGDLSRRVMEESLEIWRKLT